MVWNGAAVSGQRRLTCLNVHAFSITFQKVFKRSAADRLLPSNISKRAADQNQWVVTSISAANLLGFTTQNPGRIEVSTDGPSLPRLIVGKDTVIHTRRPESWRQLFQEDAAFLDFLRNHGANSELSPEETASRLLRLANEKGRLSRLLKVADAEPPRVRAMLGAIAEQLGTPASKLAVIRRSLNPLSRFDFGILSALKHSRKWQAKDRKQK